MGSGIGSRALLTASMLAALAVAASAQTAIGVGNPGPVVPQNGLLGTYYAYPVGSATPPGSPPGSPDNTPATQAGTTMFLQRIDGPININFDGNGPPGSPNVPTDDFFMVVWEGFVVMPAGDFAFFVASDDGERSWFGDVTAATPNLDFWVQRGVVTDRYPTAGTINYPAGNLPVRIEFEQGNGGVSINFQWQGPAPFATQATVPAANLRPPLGPNAPGGFTVTSPPSAPPPTVNLSWSASTLPVPATSYIVSRGTVSGGPYTQIAVQPGLTFTDTTGVFGTTYYYVVQGTATNGLRVGPATAEMSATPTLPRIYANPGTGLITTEAGGTATFDLTFTVAPTASVNVTVTTSDATEGNVSGQGAGPAASIPITVATGFTGTVPITVTGLDDLAADGNVNYTITFTVTSADGGYNGVAVTPAQVSNTDNDTPGISVVPVGGLITTESGGTAQFTITLQTLPAADVNIGLSVSDVTEGSLSTANAVLNAGNWNTGVVVTVTGLDDLAVDRDVVYTIITAASTSGDANYAGLNAPDVGAVNVDNEAIPDPDEAWGNCGATGLEAFLALGLAALLRRRRKC